MRLFIAVNLPPDLRQRLFDATGALRTGQFPVRWVMPEAMHITLKFLGATDDKQADAVREIISSTIARHRPFTCRVGSVGAFPSLRRPRVLWLGVEAEATLPALRDAVDNDLAQLGFEVESRPYSPHVTLGRIRNEARPAAFNGLEPIARSITIPDEPVIVRTVDLMCSHLGRGGAVYERLDAFELSDGAARQ